MHLRLLLVDDHELTRIGLRALLSSKPSWEICGEASDGYAAVKQLPRLHPDLVVLDISMPGMNGFEAAKQIRQLAPDTKIVFLSVHDLPTSAKLVGADEFVRKSDSAKQLVAAIERAAASHRGDAD